MTDYPVPEARCVRCGKPLDAATAMDGVNAPGPGDVGVCLKCHYPQIYGDDMQMREPTEEELHELARDTSVVKAMRTLKVYKLYKLVRAFQQARAR